MTVAPERNTANLEALRPSWVFRGRVPCLDGVRALAIILVVLSHAAPSIGSDRFARALSLVGGGHLGVTIFFVLSGFLITLLLLREHGDKGGVSLKQFYIRRLLRLMPAYVAFLAVMAALTYAGQIRLPQRFWVAAVTYTMCFMPHLNLGWQLCHLWSLSVEENFYLLWPAIFVLLKPKRAFAGIALYLLALPAFRYFLWWRFPNAIDIDFCSLTQMGSIATGCLLAGALRLDPGSRTISFCQRNAVRLVLVGMGGLALSLTMTRVSGKYAILFGDPANAAFIAIWIAGILFMGSGVVNRLLNSKLMVVTGVLSYSIYLWQEPFTYHSRFRACRWPINVVLTFAVAAASYALIERPFLRIKGKFSWRPPRSRGPAFMPTGIQSMSQAAAPTLGLNG